MATDRPSFRKGRVTSTFGSPEELFTKLPNRSGTHGYLRQPQADVLREYQKVVDKPNIALELPTGTGKTLVGLLISEWKRRQTSAPVAFLTVTNQLAKQVLAEAERLGIECANLCGSKDSRDPVEVGRYKTGRAIGVTTFSNLFNVNPVIQASEVLVFDDAHGGEQFVSDMWTVHIDAKKNRSEYLEAFAYIRPALTNSQTRDLLDEDMYGTVELADVRRNPEVWEGLVRTLGSSDEARIAYPWSRLRNHIEALFVFVSPREITIRPMVPPTHTHDPFSQSKQRIYMSATLGGEGDLQRGYGIRNVDTIRAEYAQWGKRYIFMPGLYMDEAAAWSTVASVWNASRPRRALLLAPSARVADMAFDNLSVDMAPHPRRLGKSDIEESLKPFTESEDSVLSLAGRYDGIDLPGDDCRLLVIAETPAAVGPFEQHLRERWRLGPILRRRERTRLIQGMGRCTRDATDFAVIFLMGSTLIDSVTSPNMQSLLPGEMQRELQWGIEQGESSKENLEAIAQIATGLLSDRTYRREANENVSEMQVPSERVDVLGKDDFGLLEVDYSHSLWAGDATRAIEVAKQVTDKASGQELSGYRAWWLYLASRAAAQQGNDESEADCLRRDRAIGINAGFLDQLLRKQEARAIRAESDEDVAFSVSAEAIWAHIDDLGWHGPVFSERLAEMARWLEAWGVSTSFHMGLERLGRCVGAETLRPTADGAPDVVWMFNDVCFTFEAKAGKTLSKKYLLQAKAHPDWLRHDRPDVAACDVRAIIASPDNSVDAVAAPHAGNLSHVSVKEIESLGMTVAGALAKMRAQFAGQDYSAVTSEWKAALKAARIDSASVEAFCSRPLSP